MKRPWILVPLIAIACRVERAPQPFPVVGVAVSDTLRSWCAEFKTDSTRPSPKPGDLVTLVFATTSARARIAQPRADQCYAAFAQPRWFDYVAYDLSLVDSLNEVPDVALVVTGESHWVLGADSVMRADLDSDDRPEDLRRCTADEGEHFTVWSVDAGRRVRRWHEYYDWGAFTDPTCGPGENGRDSAPAGP